MLNGKVRISYGIVVYETCDKEHTVNTVDSFRDITSDYIRLQKLVEQCNRLGLSPTRLTDVIEDFVNSYGN